MTVRPILHVPDQRLLQVSQPVIIDFSSFGPLVDDMIDTVVAAKGAGLAAIQVDCRLRIIVVQLETSPIKLYGEMFNPEIVRAYGDVQVHREGCLSILGETFEVARHDKIDLVYKTFAGERSKTFSGRTARIIQHEIDHLDGILISQRAVQTL